jgi:CRP-like cAMP-binding protein
MAATSTDTIVELLRKVPVLAGVDDEHLKLLSRRCRLRKVRADQTLFFRGDPGYSLFVIASGSVNIQTDGLTGAAVLHARRGAGEVIGEMALLTGHPRSADAVTAEECALIQLDREEFLACLAESPRLALNLIGSLATRLAEAAARLEARQELPVPARVAAFVLEMARVHGTEEADGGRRVRARYTDQEVADHVGATRSTVNRCLKELEAAGLIRKDLRQITILDAAALRRRSHTA